MRLFLIVIATLSLGAGATFAQEPATAPIVSPLRLHDSGGGDCMEMWDSGTHMTKQEWSRACRRVQTRLDSLDVGAMRVRKTPR
jgi:anti-sigma-K factor RskA